MKKLLFAILFVFMLSAVSALAANHNITFGEVTINGLPSSVAKFDPGTSLTIKIPVIVDNSAGTSQTKIITITSTNPLIPSQSLGSVAIAPVAAGAINTTDITFSVNIPIDQSAGRKSATVTAAEAGQSDVTQSYSFAVNEKPAVTVDPSSLAVNVQPGKTVKQTFTIKNTGNVALSNVSPSHERTEINDSKNHKITIVFSPGSVASLAVGASQTVTVSVQAEAKYAVKSESDKIFVDAISSSGQTQLARVSIPLSIDVRPLVCSAGNKGNIDIDIVHPDSSDDIEAGTLLEVEVKVFNEADEDHKFNVEASLFNLDENKEVDQFDTSKNIDDNDDITLRFNLKVPADADADDDYRIYVKASEDGNGDAVCIQEDIGVDIKELVNKVVVDGFTMSPDAPACNTDVFATLHVVNRDEEKQDVILTVRSDELGILKQLPMITLEKAFRSGSAAFPQFSFHIPQNARAGTYLLNIMANYNGGVTSWQRSVTVRECSPAQQPVQQAVQPQVSEKTQVNVPSVASVTVPSGAQQQGSSATVITGKSVLESWENVPVSAWMLANIVLVLAIVTLVMVAFRRR